MLRRSPLKRKAYQPVVRGRQWQGGEIRPRTPARQVVVVDKPVRPIAKFEYVRSPALLAGCRQLMQCMAPNCRRGYGDVDAAHSNWSCHGKGKSVKASDIYIAALCRTCHQEIDQGSKLSEHERQWIWWSAHQATVRAMVQCDLWPAQIYLPQISRWPFA